MDDIYRYALENDLVRVLRNGTIYKYYKYKKKFEKAAICLTAKDKRYETVNIYISGNQYNLYVHRLVAYMYIPNPDNKPTVNHIDGNTRNNNVKNLEWATYEEQINHAYKTGLINPMKNAVNCKYCGELTHAKDRICASRKYDLKRIKNRKETLKKTRKDLELIDLRALNLREQEIVYKRYLGQTYEEIGQDYGLSRQRIEQIISDAKLKVFEKPVYPNLVKALNESNVELNELAYYCSLSTTTTRNRLSGKTDWKLGEIISIKEKLKINDSIEHLFYKENNEADCIA